MQKIVEYHKSKDIDGIADLRDESNREGIRIVIDIKRGYNPNIILNKLFQKTYLQTTYSANLVALVNGEPNVLNLKTALNEYIKHQKIVITRRLEFDLRKAEERAHILEGLKICIANIDEVVKIIKTSQTDQIAQDRLSKRFDLSERQNKSYSRYEPKKTNRFEHWKMEEELSALLIEIKNYKEILSSEEKLIDLMVTELNEIKDRFNDSRRTKIDLSGVGRISDEDLIPETDIIITTSVKGI
ncbi:hypothetical protein NWE60_02605 [Mycoplasmopsis felis]|nr:DNA gyrase subunit A [Mycoplasmopsis felis]WAM01681.1 hypothetical protein NWE60_02605 [Mycoplasmopsis felis]